MRSAKANGRKKNGGTSGKGCKVGEEVGYVIFLPFVFVLGQRTWTFRNISEECVQYKKYLRTSKTRKIHKLTQKKQHYASDNRPKNCAAYTFFPRFVNNKDIKFTEEEQSLISKGLKQSIRPSNWEVAFERLVVDLQSHLSSGSPLIDQFASLVSSTPPEVMNPATRGTLRSIRAELENGNAALTRRETCSIV